MAVVGAGIVGTSLAIHLARRGVDVALLERGSVGGGSTGRSGAIVRTHYDSRVEAALALAGLEAFERFEEEYGGDAGFRPTGFAYVPDPHELDGALEARCAMLREVGVETEILSAQELIALDPGIDLAGVTEVAYEPRSGYADPATTMGTLATAAREAGVDIREGFPAEQIACEGGRVRGVAGAQGRVSADAVALCAGARSSTLAAGVGLELPIAPTRAGVVVLGELAQEPRLTVIDAPNSIYFRSDGARCALVGRRTWHDVALESPDDWLPEPNRDFGADCALRLERRLPANRGARLLSGRSCVLDMTPDGRPLVGPSPVEGLWLCCGWSGAGFKTGPAVGAALADWMVDGRPADPGLSELGMDRVIAPRAAPRSPH